MGKIGTKLPSFCLNRIRPHVRVRSPPIQAKFDQNSSQNHKTTQISNNVKEEKAGVHGETKPGFVIGRKIMIVVDSSFEAKGALQWALSHTVQSQDKLILLHVTRSSSKQG